MDWQKKVSLWWAKNFRPLVVALLVGCGVHYTIYANQLGNFDAVHIGALYTADGWPEHLYWETQQGRWALRLVDMLRGGINQPALSALLMLFLYALAGVLLTDLFAVRSRVAKYLIPLTLVCTPYVAEVETYHYCSVSYALSFLLAVLAVQSAVCGVRFVWLMGTVCLATPQPMTRISSRWECIRPIWAQRRACASCCCFWPFCAAPANGRPPA